MFKLTCNMRCELLSKKKIKDEKENQKQQGNVRYQTHYSPYSSTHQFPVSSYIRLITEHKEFPGALLH